MFDFLIFFLVLRRGLALGRGLAGELEALLDRTEEAFVAVVQHGDDVGRARDRFELKSGSILA